MPVPVTIADLSTTAGSNYPLGTDTPTTGDDVFRAHGSFIAQLRDKLDGTAVATGVELASPELTGTTVASYVTTPLVSAVTAYRGTSQTLTAGTNTILFNTVSADRATNYVAGTGIFTAPVTGVYQVNCLMILQNNSVSSATLTGVLVSVNSSTAVGVDTLFLDSSGGTINASSSAFQRSGACAFLLTAGATVRVFVQHTGGNLTANAGSHLSIHFVG